MFHVLCLSWFVDLAIIFCHDDARNFQRKNTVICYFHLLELWLQATTFGKIKHQTILSNERNKLLEENYFWKLSSILIYFIGHDSVNPSIPSFATNIWVSSSVHQILFSDLLLILRRFLKSRKKYWQLLKASMSGIFWKRKGKFFV